MYKNKDFLYQEYIINRKTLSQLSDECNVSESTILNWLKKYDIKKGSNHTYTLNENVLVTHPIFSYYAGLVTTDGYLDKNSNRVSLRLRNKGSYYVLSMISFYLGYTGRVHVYNDVDNDLSITSKELREHLYKYGISPQGKSFNKFPTDYLKSISEDDSRMFLRGILDGDGNIKHNGRFRITVSNKPFIEEMASYINEILGTNIKIFKDRKYWKIEMTKNDSNTFLDYVYKGYTEYKLPEKYKNYLRG